MRQRVGSDKWIEWFGEFDRSDVTVKEFCDQKGVAQNTFYAWRRKLGQSPRPADPAPFVPVAVEGEDEVRIEMPCGAIIHVPSQSCVLRPVLELLLQIGADAP